MAEYLDALLGTLKTVGGMTPMAPVANAAVAVGQASVEKAKSDRAFDQSIIEADAKVKAGKITIPELLSSPTESGFIGTPEQELAHKIKLQTNTYESPDIGIDVTNATPENLNKAINMLGSEKDVNRKLMAAMAVQAIAGQMQALNMGSYMQTARQSVGMDQLDEQIALSMQADTKSPNNPGTGVWSEETDALIFKRTQLAQNLPQLATQYAAMDPAIAGPLAASQALLKSLPITERLEISREMQERKVADISTITDVEAKNYASMTGKYKSIDWNSPAQIFMAKKAYYGDKEFQKLAQSGILSLDDPTTVRTMYAYSDSAVDKNRSYSILQRIEADSLNIDQKDISPEERVRRYSQFAENTKIIKAVYNAPLNKIIKQKIDNQLLAEGPNLSGTKAKEQRRKELELTEKDSILQEYLIKRFTSDVTQWGGVDTTNPLVVSAIADARTKTGKQNVDLQSFMGSYLNLPGQTTYGQRLKQLQSYIYSSANVANNSAILPDISGERIYNNAAPGTARVWLNSIMNTGVRN